MVSFPAHARKKMNLEVEIKAPLKGAKDKVRQLGANHIKKVTQSDTYYLHPDRDFKATDEALRIRDENGILAITYKGPKRTKDLKARVEIEFVVPEDAKNLLEALGFEPVFTIHKIRDMYEYAGLSICCDEVIGLGEYVEVEGRSLDDHDLIMDVIKELGVADVATTQSYSELLDL